MVTRNSTLPPVRSLKGPPNQSLGPITSNSINRGLAAMPAQERSIHDRRARPLAAINLSAGTERQWLGILRPRGLVRVPRPRSRSGMMSRLGSRATTRRRGHRARRLLSRSEFRLSSAGRQSAWRCSSMAGRRTLGQAPCDRDCGAGGDLHRLFRRAVVAARRRADQSRRGDAMACGRDRGKYRPRQYR